MTSSKKLQVGETIREVRKSKRIRQKVLARMVGISAGALTNFEKGRRRISLDWLHKIAEALDTPVAYFLPDESDKSRTTPGDPREQAVWMIERAAASRAAELDSLFVGDHHATAARPPWDVHSSQHV